MRKKFFLNTASILLACTFTAFSMRSQAQAPAANEISLNNLSAFKNPSSNWSVAGSVKADFNKNNTIETKNGTGILVNTPGKSHGDIYTNFEHGDIDLSVDFMMPKGSNSGIYLQGRYEIQLMDSWGEQHLSFQDLGSVYQRWDDSKPEAEKGYQGIAPRINVSRAPGLWQSIRIIFQAPKFDASGTKTQNARIVQIILNGVSIIENAELQGPTRGSAFDNEAAMGPLRIQGDHGAVAFKNFKYTNTVVTTPTNGSKEKTWTDVDQPIYVTVANEPVLLRSFVDIQGERVTHAVNAGYPHNISFSYNLGNGAAFQVWKGGFVDATPMWHFRGDGSTKPIGSVLYLGNAPAVAVLAANNTAWPDTLATGSFTSHGYELNEAGYPTFKYTVNGLNVDDRLASADGKMLTRTLTLVGPVKNNLYIRAAAGNDITEVGNGMYAINNYEYYVQFDKGAKPVIRSSAKGKEILIPVKDADKGVSVTYSIIW